MERPLGTDLSFISVYEFLCDFKSRTLYTTTSNSRPSHFHSNFSGHKHLAMSCSQNVANKPNQVPEKIIDELLLVTGMSVGDKIMLLLVLVTLGRVLGSILPGCTSGLQI